MERVARNSFLLNIVFLILHEMDAIHWKEWRLFGVTDDILGRILFLLAHIPLFILILHALLHFDTMFGRIMSTFVSGFLFVHFFLHWSAFSLNLFNEPTSEGIIAAMLVISMVQLPSALYLFKIRSPSSPKKPANA